MPKNTIPLALAPLRRIAKESGAGSISQKGLEELSTALEQHTKDVAKKSVELAEHSARSTILARDINLAKK